MQCRRCGKELGNSMRCTFCGYENSEGNVRELTRTEKNFFNGPQYLKIIVSQFVIMQKFQNQRRRGCFIQVKDVNLILLLCIYM